MSCLPVTDKTLPRFREVCACERLFGSRSLCAHIAGTAQSFLLEDALPAALSLTGGRPHCSFPRHPRSAGTGKVYFRTQRDYRGRLHPRSVYPASGETGWRFGKLFFYAL
jgi:hypothetical protein